MALICKKCGYKQGDEETILEMKKIFPQLEEHDIPYYCGACMDEASEEDYITIDQQFRKLEEKLYDLDHRICELEWKLKEEKK